MSSPENRDRIRPMMPPSACLDILRFDAEDSLLRKLVCAAFLGGGDAAPLGSILLRAGTGKHVL